MKIRLPLALVGLAISFALPAFAQQIETADPQLRQDLLALAKKVDDAWNNNDAAAVAALLSQTCQQMRVSLYVSLPAGTNSICPAIHTLSA